MSDLIGPKYPGEDVFVDVDFTDRLPSNGSVTVVSGSISISVQIGDPDPGLGAMMVGTAAVASNVVQQACRNGVVGNHYKLQFTANCSNGAVLEEVRFMEVT